MASKSVVRLCNLRTIASCARRTSQSSFQCARTFSLVSSPTARISRPALSYSPGSTTCGAQQKRWDSRAAEARGTKIYQFEDVLDILENPADSRLLIDVREPHEYEANTIPTSINLPVASQPDALLLNEEDFEDRFGFEKPPIGKEVVFFCKAGVRSSTAAAFARQAGYINVGEYRGSWLDWQKHGGPGTKTPPKPDGPGEPTRPVTETKPTASTGESGEEDIGNQRERVAPKGGIVGGRQ
ncbi:hypothetical protein ACN47E_007478 [Coniothyrium glycines]